MAKTKPKRRAKGWQFRNVILDRLKEDDRSNYWLAHAVSDKFEVTPDSIYRYLRGETDATGYTIASCFKVLEIPMPE